VKAKLARKPVEHVRLPPVETQYQVELRKQQRLIIRCTQDLHLCIRRVSAEHVEIHTRAAPRPRPRAMRDNAEEARALALDMDDEDEREDDDEADFDLPFDRGGPP